MHQKPALSIPQSVAASRIIMAEISQTNKRKFEKLLEMDSGYVLDFTNNTFQEFFLNTAEIDIYNSKYDRFGDSKAKRLRAFWHVENNELVGKVLIELVEYWKSLRLIEGKNISTSEEALFESCLTTAYSLARQTRPSEITAEEDFINKEFENIDLDNLPIPQPVRVIIEHRIDEIRKCLKSKAPLSIIFMCGSVLEGILLGLASSDPKSFNKARAAPIDHKTGKVRKLQNWTLSNLIDVAHELGKLGLDVKKHSHTLRDFRNYIHPFEQLSSGFDPDSDTSKISWQVLQAAIADLS